MPYRDLEREPTIGTRLFKAVMFCFAVVLLVCLGVAFSTAQAASSAGLGNPQYSDSLRAQYEASMAAARARDSKEETIRQIAEDLRMLQMEIEPYVKGN